ncbi:MAG: hypothetical protein IJ719_04765 [Clostridia bacterium]|nr:hypothetical protein [Clostridia bacterium]
MENLSAHGHDCLRHGSKLFNDIRRKRNKHQNVGTGNFDAIFKANEVNDNAISL